MKILFFGLGSIGRRHARILQEKYPEIQLLSYKTHMETGLVENHGKSGDIRVFTDMDEAFACKPDAAFITNPTSMHVITAVKAAENKCHLFIEKPLSDRLDGVEELIGICRDKKIITHMGCNLRFNPVLLKIKGIIEDKSLGRPLSFRVLCSSYLPDWRPRQDYRDSYSAKKSLGGGVILDLIHELDYTYWILGDFTGYRSFSGKASRLEIETEDYADIILRTASGAVGHIHLDYYGGSTRRSIEITCENGIVEGDLVRGRVHIDGTGKVEDTLEFETDRDYTYEKQIEYFIRCIREGKESLNGIDTGYKVLKYALDIKKYGLEAGA